MISAISKCITSPGLVKVAQSADATMATKTTVNTIGRPGFILADDDIDSHTKKFAATKEFVYQLTCLVVYMLLIVPVFKAGAFKIAKNYLYKGMKNGKPIYEGGFDKFKNAREFLEYRNYADKSLETRKTELSKGKGINKFNHDSLREDLMSKKDVELYPKIKGAIELGSILGSIIGLSILTPQINNKLINPVMKALDFKNDSGKEDIEDIVEDVFDSDDD